MNSVASVTLGGVTRTRFTWDRFNNSRTGFQPQWALKMTPLNLNLTTADDYQVRGLVALCDQGFLHVRHQMTYLADVIRHVVTRQMAFGTC